MTSPLLGFAPFNGTYMIEQFLLAVCSGLLLAIQVGMLISWVLMISRLVNRQPIFPEPPFSRLTPVPWRLETVFAVFILYFISMNAAASICAGFGLRNGLPPKIELPTATSDPVADHRQADAPVRDSGSERAAREALILTSVTNVLFLTAFPWVFRKTSGVSLRRLGVTSSRGSEQAVAGILTGLIIILPVYVVMQFCARIFVHETHPVEKMLRNGFSASTALLACVSAVLLAPIIEETILRGVLQGWLTRLYGPSLAPSTESIATALPSETAPQDEVDGKPNVVCWPAVTVTSVLFAALHYDQWPAPIPLFLFSMIVGTVYQKTGSLLTAITAHALFNGLTTLSLVSQQLDASLRDAGILAAPAPAWLVWDLATRVIWIFELIDQNRSF